MTSDEPQEHSRDSFATSHSSAPVVVFSHGLEGEPWGTKIAAMAPIAQRRGLRVESIDYRGLQPLARVEKLLAAASTLPQPLILVGSSLGAHVAATVSAKVATRGMFLLAPAFYMKGYEEHTPVPADCPIEIVHGWHDTVVPPDNAVRFARQYRSTIHLIDSDHRLSDSIEMICGLFDLFLERVA